MGRAVRLVDLAIMLKVWYEAGAREVTQATLDARIALIYGLDARTIKKYREAMIMFDLVKRRNGIHIINIETIEKHIAANGE